MAERKRTNAEIDNLNQYLSEGETPLPYEMDDANTESKELSEEEKLDDGNKIQAESDQKILDEGEVEKINAVETDADKATSTEAKIEIAEVEELNDEKVLAYLKNKKGKEVTSLDEFLNPKKELTPEEKLAAQEKRDADKISYGLTKGLFSKKQLEDFIKDTSNPKELVYSVYAAQQKENDPTLSDSDIETEFEEKFSLNEDKDSRAYKAGQLLINNFADTLISKKHSKILNLDNDYSSYENSVSTQKESEEKILSQAPAYKKDIEAVRSEIQTISIPISKDENFEVKLDEKIVDEIVAQMLEENYSKNQIQKGWDKETVKQVAQNYVIMKTLPKILSDYAASELLKKQAGVRGITPEGKQGSRTQAAELTENQKKALGLIDTALGTMVAN